MKTTTKKTAAKKIKTWKEYNASLQQNKIPFSMMECLTVIYGVKKEFCKSA